MTASAALARENPRRDAILRALLQPAGRLAAPVPMPRRSPFPFFHPLFGRTLHRAAVDIGSASVKAGAKMLEDATKRKVVQRRAATGTGDWIAGMAFGPAGLRRYRLYRPAGVGYAERLPLVVMLHGCGQDAAAFAASTRMNALAASESASSCSIPSRTGSANVQRLLELVRHPHRPRPRRGGD